MINKINKIKNLGIFSDYKWDVNLENFTRYNLIYGWNGCGKTTLSRLFSVIESGESLKYPSLEYEIEDESTKWKNGQKFNDKVRVFNRDYVIANIEKVDGTGPNPIFILGDENKKLVAQIEKDEHTLKNYNDAIKSAKAEKEIHEKLRGEIFTNIARIISENFSGESTRSYRRPNAESDFLLLTSPSTLSVKDIEILKMTLIQQEKPKIDLVNEPEKLQKTIDDNILFSKELLAKEVTSIVIERLAKLPDISEWVEHGIELHNLHSSSTCEFCGQIIPTNRLREIGEHFNKADKMLKDSIEEQLTSLRKTYDTINNLSTPDKANFYDELQPEYQQAIDLLNTSKQLLLTDISNLGKTISEKKARTTEKMSLVNNVDASEFLNKVRSINDIIDKHNLKTKNFEKEKENARNDLKAHYLSGITKEIEQVDKDIQSKQNEIGILTNGDPDDDSSIGISELASRILENRSKISSSHKACKQINDGLKSFLGRDDLMFEVDGDGYVIKRNGDVANDLSEGEKTAIAFVYFTVQLQDQDFDIKNGIVVIDDPISSLDSNSLFQAFSFLKDSTKDVRQVFILTHNLDFFRQVKNWYNHIKKITVNGLKKKQTAFYMINNVVNNLGRRVALIAPLDRLLWEYESEYHYLFSLLYTFESDGKLESVYNFPNIGRKFIETFLAFKIPSNENLFDKVGHLEYDEKKKTAILRFIETHSHANRTDGVLNFDMSLPNGGQIVIRDLLDMVKTVDQVHYDALLKAHTDTR